MLQPLEQQIWQLLEAGVSEQGLRLVRVRFTGGSSGHNVLQVMIEPLEANKDNPVSATVDQCATVSRMASALLDVEDIIASRYTLEVSSTGMERPLVTENDFVDYAGCRIKVQMAVPFENRRKFVGLLQGLENGSITIILDENGEAVSLPLQQIKYAHLFFTDADMKNFMNSIEE